MPHSRPPFHCGEYDITERRLKRRQEVSIRSVQEPVPRCGDRFTIVREEGLRDVTVSAVLRRGSEWTAVCTVASPF